MIDYVNLDVSGFKSIYWTIVCFAHYISFVKRKINLKMLQLFEQQHQTIDKHLVIFIFIFILGFVVIFDLFEICYVHCSMSAWGRNFFSSCQLSYAFLIFYSSSFTFSLSKQDVKMLDYLKANMWPLYFIILRMEKYLEIAFILSLQWSNQAYVSLVIPSWYVIFFPRIAIVWCLLFPCHVLVFRQINIRHVIGN